MNPFMRYFVVFGVDEDGSKVLVGLHPCTCPREAAEDLIDAYQNYDTARMEVAETLEELFSQLY